jgi:Ca2+-binding RTX toxin-like protein
MASTSELQAIKSANPSFSIPGLDTNVGLVVDESSLKSPQTLTGVPGIYFNAATKTLVVYQNGVTLSGFDLTGLSVLVQANNVTVSNCKFDAAAGSYALKVFPGFANAVIDHCAFDGLKLDRAFEDFVVAQGSNTTITNSTFVNAPSDAIYIESGTIAHNVITGGGYRTGAHPDAIWIGKTTGAVTISDNVIDWRNPADSRAETNNAIRVTGENGNVNEVTVSHNVILGGSTSALVSDGPTQTHPVVGTVTNVEVTDNVIDLARWGYLNTENRPDDLVYAGNVLATGPSPAIVMGMNPPVEALNHLTGSSIADSLSGSSQADVIAGGVGVDWISAGAGNDIIISGAGGDYLTGGAGTDYFTYTSVIDVGLGAQRDRIADFQTGVDKIYLAGLAGLPPEAADASWHLVGTKYFTGTPLEIRCYLSGGNTIVAFDLNGDMTADMEIALTGAVSLTAGDFLITATTPDFNATPGFVATTPTITINGTTGNNTLNGTAAAESINGDAGNDTINGSGGDDVIVGGRGKDTMTGGAGHDRFVLETSADSGIGGAVRDAIQDFTHGDDVIDLSAIDAKTNVAGHDAFSWIGGSNFSGAAGQLRYQLVGSYTVVYGDTNGDKVADFEIGLSGNHTVTSADFLFGTPLPAAATKMGWASVGDAPDLSAYNNIAGSSAADTLKGSTQADYIAGGNGNDWIGGGAGDDVIHGGAGRDYLTGGAGADTFYFVNTGEFGDVITDFQAGVDKIYLAELAGLPAAARNEPWSFLGTGAYTGHALELRSYQSGGKTFVSADLDGDRATDIWLELSGTHNLTGADFVVANFLL